MLLFFYNLIQLFLVISIGLLTLPFFFFKRKYRATAKFRLAYDLKSIPPKKEGQKSIYFHALSVGETLSIIPLIREIKSKYPQSRIILTTGTTSGYELAKEKLFDIVDGIAVAPIDLLPVVKKFYQRVSPDIYIHTETDFWLNRLATLRNLGIPMILVNGQLSEKSIARYRRFPRYFQAIFSNFDLLCMQTENGKKDMIRLNTPTNRVKHLGNLKFTKDINAKKLPKVFAQLKNQTHIIVAGSTHDGEEKYLLHAFNKLLNTFPKAKLIIAPRDINRSIFIKNEAKTLGFSPCLRSSKCEVDDVLIVDSLGELLSFYDLADVCFVGGSLVNRGGHNPIEPAHFSKPIIFGKYMSDFSEISRDLLASDAAIEIKESNLYDTIENIFLNPKLGESLGNNSYLYSQKNNNVLQRHMDEITNSMNHRGKH
ncbi:MAG: 3-deoxy-D-manno-octulosonic acid transferase [Desulfotalea sp.]